MNNIHKQLWELLLGADKFGSFHGCKTWGTKASRIPRSIFKVYKLIFMSAFSTSENNNSVTISCILFYGNIFVQQSNFILLFTRIMIAT